MKVAELGVVVKDPAPLQLLIRQKYRNARNFSNKAGFTESMMSHILHGRRKIYPWSEDVMVNLLDITQVQFRKLIGG